jgi:hypothetical protein
MALDVYGGTTGPAQLNRDTFETGAFIAGIDLSRNGHATADYINSSFDASSVSVAGNFSIATGATYTGAMVRMIYFSIYKVLI